MVGVGNKAHTQWPQHFCAHPLYMHRLLVRASAVPVANNSLQEKSMQRLSSVVASPMARTVTAAAAASQRVGVMIRVPFRALGPPHAAWIPGTGPSTVPGGSNAAILAPGLASFPICPSRATAGQHLTPPCISVPSHHKPMHACSGTCLVTLWPQNQPFLCLPCCTTQGTEPLAVSWQQRQQERLHHRSRGMETRGPLWCT